jgi:predicted nucleic acid-binding protein
VGVLFAVTSALVRRYDYHEPGAARVRELCGPAAGNALYISWITPAEVASAFTRKRREGSIDEQGLRRLWRLFRAHRLHEYGTVSLDTSIVAQAERLLFRYPLRAYDAVQVASAQRVARTLVDLLSDFRFCTADRPQVQAAQSEGLRVEFIS